MSQNQTYANSNSGYYVRIGEAIDPTHPVALISPVEFLFDSTIQGAYYGEIVQTPSTLIFAEHRTSNLSTINSLIMEPTKAQTSMTVLNLASEISEPVIQRWTNTSTIVNGVFKAGNKNLNDEANAYYIQNGNLVTAQGQGNVQQITSIVNESTRFQNSGNLGLIYTGIDQRPSQSGVSIVNLTNSLTLHPSTIVFNNLSTSSVAGRIGVEPDQPTALSLRHPLATARNLLLTGSDTRIGQSTIVNQNGVTITDGSLSGTNFFTLTPSLLQQSQFGQAILNVGTDAFPNPAGFIANAQGSSRNISLLNNSTIIHGSTIFTPNLQDGPALITDISTINVSTLTDSLSALPNMRLATNSTIINYANFPTAATMSAVNISSINGSTVAPSGPGFLPPGALIPWAPAVYTTTTPPAGYLFCDGAVYANGLYPQLAALMGTTYGGTPGVSFAVPDMRFGKSIIGGAINNASFQVLQQPGGGSFIVSTYNDTYSLTVGGVEYGTTRRAFYIKPQSPGPGNTYKGPGVRAGYHITVNSGTGARFNIVDTLNAPFGNNANGPYFNVFLLDTPLTGDDYALFNNGITVFPYPAPGTDINTNLNYYPVVTAGSNNPVLSYYQRSVEVGNTQYTVFRGGDRAIAGAAQYYGDPNTPFSAQYLNSCPTWRDYDGNTQRTPAGSNIPNAFSYAMGYIIKT